MRRTLGVGGATAVAIAATLTLTGVAGAHTPKFTPGCVGGDAPTLTVNLSNYEPNKQDPNTVSVSYLADGATKPTAIWPTTDFQSTWASPQSATIEQNSKEVANPFYVTGKVGGTFTITIYAQDDPKGAEHGNHGKYTGPDGQGQWDGTFTVSVKTCSNSQPPTTTVPTQPGQSTQPSTQPPTTTPAAVVAAAPTNTPPSASSGLAYTGVDATLPLAIGGGLIVIGAAALVGMRLTRKRRTQN